MNLQDSSLLDALDALAGLGMGAGASQKTADRDDPRQKNQEEYGPIDSEQPNEAGTASVTEDAREAEESDELIPQPLPEPVELPPLEKPVALVESASFREISPADSVKPVVTGSRLERDPLVELASLANRPASSDSRVSASAAPNTSLITLVFVSALSFLAGFLVHAQFFSKDPARPEGEPKTEATRRGDSGVEEEGTSQTAQTAHKHAVAGRITFRTREGNSQPDAGATVILLPVSRSSSVKLPIIGFRPADHQEDRDVARASVRALGGDVCPVGTDGRFAAELEQSGNYHVLVLSHFQQRADEDVRLSENVKTVLLDYFDRPEQLPGRRRYHLGYVYYRGEETEIWDYSFERL